MQGAALYFSRGRVRQLIDEFDGPGIFKGRNPGFHEILHLGDHDPSGLDMSRDNDDRVSLFMGAKADVRRLALNHDQTQELDLPPNAAKSSDTRFKTYVQEFGPKSWELDALPPEYMAQLVRGAVLDLRDDARWDEDVARQEAERLDLDAVAANWDAVVQFVRTVA